MFKTYVIAGAVVISLTLLGAGCPNLANTGSSSDNNNNTNTNANTGNSTNTNTSQNTSLTPAISIVDQTPRDNIITIKSVTATENGWVDIHADNNGQPGRSVGVVRVTPGTSENLSLEIDILNSTRRLYAMLHKDLGQPGVFEFPGADTPVMEGGQTVTVPFNLLNIPTSTSSTLTNPNPPNTSSTTTTSTSGSKNDSSATVKTFTISSKQFDFEPDTITVNKGDKVKIILKSTDVRHGFNLPDYNINKTVDPGKIVTIEFTADKAGTFEFFCSVPCGPGHKDMTGKLIVKETKK
jgi:cytochrome c oxidase subunit 2